MARQCRRDHRRGGNRDRRRPPRARAAGDPESLIDEDAFDDDEFLRTGPSAGRAASRSRRTSLARSPRRACWRSAVGSGCRRSSRPVAVRRSSRRTGRGTRSAPRAECVAQRPPRRRDGRLARHRRDRPEPVRPRHRRRRALRGAERAPILALLERSAHPPRSPTRAAATRPRSSTPREPTAGSRHRGRCADSAGGIHRLSRVRPS